MSEQLSVKVDAVVFRDDLYPRIETDPPLVQRYAECIELLPPIEINQHNELIDGWHRWTAHKKAKIEDIKATVTPTASEAEFLALAIRRNAQHGKQLCDGDKKKMAIRLYNAGEGVSDKAEIASILSVSVRQVTNYLTDIEKQLREDRKERIFDMWLACHTQDEIAEAVGFGHKDSVSEIIEECRKSEALPISDKLASEHADGFEVPLYDVWTFNKKTNSGEHFGNTEATIVDRLLYMYTEPFDIVVDPFGGGGATVDVCKKRLRRYWCSDRLVQPEQEGRIRLLDCIADGPPPLARNWSEVSLTYLDPPYWKQAEGEYSDDAEDLANMPLDQFTESLSKLVTAIASKQSNGAIGLIIQPTQWRAEDRKVADHVVDIIAGVRTKKVRLAHRIQCPYQTQQYNAQQVEWAKQHREVLVISRELVVWTFDV